MSDNDYCYRFVSVGNLTGYRITVFLYSCFINALSLHPVRQTKGDRHHRLFKQCGANCDIFTMPPFLHFTFLTSEAIKIIGISVFALVQYLLHEMKGTWGLEQELRHASGIHWVYLKLCNKSNQRGLCAAEVAANLPWNQWFRAVAVCCLQMVSVKREGRKGGRKRKREGKIHHLGKDRLKRSGFLTISMPVLFFLSLIAKKRNCFQ